MHIRKQLLGKYPNCVYNSANVKCVLFRDSTGSNRKKGCRVLYVLYLRLILSLIFVKVFALLGCYAAYIRNFYISSRQLIIPIFDCQEFISLNCLTYCPFTALYL